MSLSARIREQLISSFRVELAEHVQTMTNGLLALEQGRLTGEQRQPTLEEVFRAAHSLKGAARAVGVMAVEQLAHALEDPLEAMRRDDIVPTPALFTACYQALDAIQAVQAAYEAGETTPPVQALQALAGLEPFRRRATSGERQTVSAGDEEQQPVAGEATGTAPAAPLAVPVAPASEDTIRVSVSKLDALMAQLSELLVTKIRAEQRLAQMQQVQETMVLWQKDWLAARNAYDRLARPDRSGAASKGGNGHGGGEKELSRVLDYVRTSQDRLREMTALMNTLARQYADDMTHQALVIDALEQEIKRVRMLPLSTITGPFGRMMRDLAQAAGKEAALTIAGGAVELDKRVLEQIKDPLIHLLRNAIDHGIELPEHRVARGKPRVGTVTLAAEQLGQDVVICVADDGAGLDLEAIRQAAARHEDVDAQTLSKAELKELIFKAGITTSRIITDISGRGIGLDVVRRNVEALHGRIDVAWTPGAGATFTLTLPLTLTSARGLLVRTGGELFAIPFNAVDRIDYVSPAEIFPLAGHDVVRHNGRPIAWVRLGDVLELPRRDAQPTETRIITVILAAAERRMAFAVDELAGEQEVVIKSLGKQLARVGGITGATLLGSGEIVLILNAVDLFKLASRLPAQSEGARYAASDQPVEAAPFVAARVQPRILIVDDSITTRTLEKNILEAAGYTVQVALDGQEALGAIAASGVPDLIISDVAMPRMDGFELTRRLKGDPHTAHLPVILVTSLDSPADKVRGIEVGADAYIVKSRFDQHNLLETIEQLI